MQTEYSYLNGRLVPAGAALVSAADRGFLYGDGVFETLRAYGGRPFQLAEHVERLYRSAALIGLELPWPDRAVREAVEAVLGANGLTEAYIRITVTRGEGVGIEPPAQAVPTLFVQASRLNIDDRVYQEGIGAVVARVRRNLPAAVPPQAKTLNYLNNILAHREARAAGAQEAIMLNFEGTVAEGSMSNVFVVFRGELLTPPVATGIFPGLTRATVLRLAREVGQPVAERPFGPELLLACDEVFLTNSVREVVPVVRLNGRPVGAGKPGPVTRLLLAAYRDVVRGALGGPGR
ncbi:MAG: aminotransferase class IV, partial [Firmicutes bacterium]|nr:aminotransferase class IV [Bacillota bacterium]